MKLKIAVAASLVLSTFPLVCGAQDARLDPLFQRLVNVDAADAPALADKIIQEWSKSGSPAMDLLLARARKAILADDFETALIHLNALTDHAPDFAEGWNMRAAAYYNVDKFGPALEALERALHLEPRHFQAMAGLMVMLEEAGQQSQALEVARMIQAIHPHYENLSESIQRLDAATDGQAL
ncbi:MAG: hypothetical protein ACPGRD_08105 [Planktomarina sp.]